jgi:PPOX class probable F420-dependent enzyme
MSIFSDEAREVLTSGTRTGKVGWIAPDGRPLVTPVWFLLDGDDVLFTTGADSSKGRYLRRDPRLVLCVDVEEPPYGFVQVQGTATVHEDLDELLAVATALGKRYMGADRAEAFGKRNAVPGELLVRLRPTRVRAEFNLSD